MKPNPLVTVLMAVYNGGEYLKQSIESVLSQTFRNFELLIINDSSTDNSMETIRSFNDPRITVHTNGMNMGQTRSLNIGIRLAKGKYVARMDADDMAYPLWLEKLAKSMKEHPENAAIGSAAVVIDSLGNVKEIRRMPSPISEVFFWIFYAPPINHVSVFLNKNMILKTGGYDEEFKITQDYELWSSLIRNNYQITNIQDILVAYRFHSSSIGFGATKSRGLDEKSETIFRNIRSFTNLRISRDDAKRICKLFYHTASMDFGEFQSAERNFKKIYINLKKPFKLPSELTKKGVKAQMLKPYCKLATYKIQNGEMGEGRRIASRYGREYGFHIMPFIIFLASFLGCGISGRIPSIYEKWLEIVTKLVLQTKHLKIKP